MNLFDNLQSAMVSTVTNTMGYDAYWVRQGSYNNADFDAIDFDSADFNVNTEKGRVLFNGPTEREKLFAADYDPNKLMMEYNEGTWPQLFEAARKNYPVQQVIIEGIGVFNIKTVGKKWDGKTYEAFLEYK